MSKISLKKFEKKEINMEKFKDPSLYSTIMIPITK